jgi:hypothetical protein
MKVLAIFALSLVLCVASAADESSGAVLGEFGLLNATWAPDCSKQASVSNWYGRYKLLPTNEARLTFSAKPGDEEGELAYVILSARRVSPREVQFEMEFVQEKRQLEIVLEVEKDRYRTVTAKRSDGIYQISGGKLTDDGSDSPWYYRCP